MRARMILACLIGAIVVGNAPAIISEASAAPGIGCEHREAGHVSRHGGQLEDDRFHRVRGERVTCSAEKPQERHGDDTRHDEHHGDGCIGRCNRDHSLWH